MTNLLIYGYYYRYRQYRKNIKDLISVDNNTSEARTQLNSLITEHDNYIVNTPDSQFTLDENNIIHHANIHLTAFENNSQPHQKTATMDVLDEQY